jgi:hypothetical protein
MERLRVRIVRLALNRPVHLYYSRDPDRGSGTHVDRHDTDGHPPKH